MSDIINFNEYRFKNGCNLDGMSDEEIRQCAMSHVKEKMNESDKKTNEDLGNMIISQTSDSYLKLQGLIRNLFKGDKKDE